MPDNDIIEGRSAEERFSSSICKPETATGVFPAGIVQIAALMRTYWHSVCSFFLQNIKTLGCLCSAKKYDNFFFLFEARMSLLACLWCSWVSLLCLKQQLVHRLTVQDEGFPVAVTEAWKRGNVTRQDFYDIPITSLSPEPLGLWVYGVPPVWHRNYRK